MLRELELRSESRATPDVDALMRFDIQVSSRLVFRQLLLQFECFVALLTRLRVNMVAYEVKDAIVCEVVMLSQRRSAPE